MYSYILCLSVSVIVSQTVPLIPEDFNATIDAATLYNPWLSEMGLLVYSHFNSSDTTSTVALSDSATFQKEPLYKTFLSYELGFLFLTTKGVCFKYPIKHEGFSDLVTLPSFLSMVYIVAFNSDTQRHIIDTYEICPPRKSTPCDKWQFNTSGVLARIYTNVSSIYAFVTRSGIPVAFGPTPSDPYNQVALLYNSFSSGRQNKDNFLPPDIERCKLNATSVY